MTALDLPAMIEPLPDMVITNEWSTDGIYLRTCRGVSRPSNRTAPVLTKSWSLTLARRGAYRRRVDGVEHIVDANTGFLRGPGQEVSTAAFATTPDEYTTRVLGAPFLHHLPDLTSSRRPITVEPRIALAHRLLLRSLEQPADALEMEAAILALVHCCLRRTRPDRRIGRRITTAAARQRLVTDVVEALHASFGEPSGLVDLGRMVGASPYHLSRVFREVTGTTISQYRTWLRVHAVLHRLDQGDHDLAGVAAATGFADHSHMTRTVSGHLGEAPSILRQLLSRV